ncbi:MAG: PA0069 family radical SAM protein [Burkholderiales bacterium]|nr:MAG: PA0069 family radical SAM protein [Burkholderiales bacterium]
MEFDATGGGKHKPGPAPRSRGRGALDNLPGRFERLVRESFDDGWHGERSERGAEDGSQPLTILTREQARTVLTRNQSPDVFFDLSVNPYRGCEHGCAYCYARPTHSYLGLSPGLDFETRIFAKVNAAQRLREALAAPGYRCEPIVIGTVTDPYQPLERRQLLTRRLLEVAAEARLPVALITKGSMIERDLDLLGPMARSSLAAVYVTVTTLDPSLARRMEPRAAAPWKRLQAVRRLADAGVPVGVMIAPIIPFLNEPEIESIAREAAAAGARSAHYTVLRLPWELREVFEQWLGAQFPERAARVMARIGDLRGGRANDPRFGTRMRGEGVWAELIRARFDRALRTNGLSAERATLDCAAFRAPSVDGQLALI